MARTRVNSNNAVDPAVPTTPGASSPLPRSTNLGSMQKVLILPRRATPEARIVLLPNSRHGRPARYLMCPETGLYEFITMTPSEPSLRSWLIETRNYVSHAHSASCSATTAEARIVVDSNIYMATPLDPVFLVLPALEGRQAFSKEAHGKRSLFRSSDDYLDELSGDLPHLCEILSWPGTKALFRDRMAAVCDSVEADDEIMFRLNEDKLAKVILSKAMMLSDGGLPSTMEQRFVISVLEAPPLSEQETDHQGLPLQSDSTDSLAVTSDTATVPPSRPAATNISRADQNGASETVTNASEPPLHIIHLQRLRVALDFICSNYISPSLTQRLFILLIDSGLADFSPLDDYLASVIKRRAAAVHLSSLSNFSRKRSDEDDEARAAKKRKLEDEKRQKATESRGVRQLKKADTSGMKKLSAFFRKN